jgi:hypothetical protein
VFSGRSVTRARSSRRRRSRREGPARVRADRADARALRRYDRADQRPNAGNHRPAAGARWTSGCGSMARCTVLWDGCAPPAGTYGPARADPAGLAAVPTGTGAYTLRWDMVRGVSWFGGGHAHLRPARAGGSAATPTADRWTCPARRRRSPRPRRAWSVRVQNVNFAWGTNINSLPQRGRQHRPVGRRPHQPRRSGRRSAARRGAKVAAPAAPGTCAALRHRAGGRGLVRRQGMQTPCSVTVRSAATPPSRPAAPRRAAGLITVPVKITTSARWCSRAT